MHFNLKRVVAISAIPLLGGALAVGATAPPASAQTYQDTSLQANPPISTDSVSLALSFSTGYSVTCSSGLTGQPLTVAAGAANPAGGLTLSGPATCTGGTQALTLAGSYVSGTYFWEVSASPNPSHNATEVAALHLVVSGGAITQGWSESVSLKSPPNTVYPNIQFSGTDVRNCFGFGAVPASQDPCGTAPIVSGIQTLSQPLSGTWAPTNLPAGLAFSTVTSGLLVPGTAVPGTYKYATVSGTEGAATASETFSLTVQGHVVMPPPAPGNYGDEVNPYGNGFDVYQQHMAVNAIIAGWTATQADPATHFIRLPGTVSGAYQYEYAPYGTAVGLCVSDPGYDAAGTGLTNGLVLRGCNTGPWQQFTPQSNGTLVNVATGLVVSPNGTGAQLRGTVYPTPWGGSIYTWTDYAHLPG
jgi:hypothetical protein